MATNTPRPVAIGVHLDAPIRYRDVRKSFNTMRTIGGVAIALASAITIWWGATSTFLGVAIGFVMAADGWYRRSHGANPLPLVLVDAGAMGLLLLVYGHAPAIEIAVFIYVVTVSLLLLTLQRALLTILIAAALAVPIVVWGPLAGGSNLTSGQEMAYATAIALVFTSMIAQLLFIAGRSLHVAIEQQRQALETERRASALKNEFVSMVSHELRTPLTSIAGFTDTLRESWSAFGPGEVEEFLAIMRRETEHLRDLVEDILVIPRLEAGQLRLDIEELDMRRAVFASGDAVFTSDPTEFVVTIPGGVSVLADRVRLNQVLRNLLENARKYGGDQVLVDGDLSDGLFRVAISDNGPGVPEEDIDRIFDHFEQRTKGDARSEEGIGLGLPIARRLVDAMGGDLWYEPRFPIGARFCFTLPLANVSGESIPAETQPVTPAPQRSPETVN